MYFKNVDVEAISKYLFDGKNTEAVYLIFLASEDMFNTASLIDLFNMQGVTFTGGIFPYLINEGKVHEKGVIIQRYSGKGRSFIFEGDLNGAEDMLPLIEYVKTENPDTAFLMLDGLSENLSVYLSELYRYLGTSVKYFGAGAGTSDLVQKPVLFSEKGLIENGMVVMFCECKVGLSVKHGWRKFKGPLLVTESEKNHVKSLNWRNAFEVYKEELGGHTANISRENFREKSLGYPLGLYREDSEVVVRTPITINSKDELVCMGNVDDNALIHIMEGDKDSLCDAARDATRESLKKAGSVSQLVVFESFSRYRFLGKNMYAELEAIRSEFLKYPYSQSITGVLSLGNAASLDSGYLEFFSKSVLIGAFYEES